MIFSSYFLIFAQAVERTAAEIAARSPLAVVGTKQVLLYQRDHSIKDGLDYVATWNAAMLPSLDLDAVLAARKDRGQQPVFSKL